MNQNHVTDHTATSIARERLFEYLDEKLADEWDTTGWEFYTHLLEQAKKHKKDYSGFESQAMRRAKEEARRRNASVEEREFIRPIPEPFIKALPEEGYAAYIAKAKEEYFSDPKKVVEDTLNREELKAKALATRYYVPDIEKANTSEIGKLDPVTLTTMAGRKLLSEERQIKEVRKDEPSKDAESLNRLLRLRDVQRLSRPKLFEKIVIEADNLLKNSREFADFRDLKNWVSETKAMTQAATKDREQQSRRL